MKKRFVLRPLGVLLPALGAWGGAGAPTQDPRASDSQYRTDTRSVLLPKDAPGKTEDLPLGEVGEGEIRARLDGLPEGLRLCICIGIPGLACRPFCGPGPVVSGSLEVTQGADHFHPGSYAVRVYYAPWDAPRSQDVRGTLTITFPAAEDARKTRLFLSGTITNSTNAANPVTAPATIAVDSSGNCVVRIEAPLFGSGPCSITMYEPGGVLSLVSQGPLNRILWTGRHATSNQIAGTYSLENLAQSSLPDHGSFALSVGDGAALLVPDVLRIARTTVDGKDYLVVQERNLISLHRPDGSYAGARLLLGPTGEAVLFVLDYPDGSRILDPATKAVVTEWVANGAAGYHVGRNGKIKQYYDRFLNPLPWSSLSLDDGDEVFLKSVGDDVELFDKELRPLNIRSGKTASGRFYWTKTEGDTAAFFDERFQPLNWYALQRNGQLIYASVDRRGKAHFFDGKMRELGRPSFWRKLATGLAVGLYAYSQALQAQAAQAASPPPLLLPAPPSLILPAPPPLPSVGWQPIVTTTITTRIGGMTIANTYGGPGGSSSIYTQRVGSLDLLSGTSPSGGWLQGYVQHVGSMAFVNLQTPGDSWSGTSQSIGNFTFHRFDSVGGAAVTGFSQRIGDFIFTTLR